MILSTNILTLIAVATPAVSDTATGVSVSTAEGEDIVSVCTGTGTGAAAGGAVTGGFCPVTALVRVCTCVRAVKYIADKRCKCKNQ